MFESNEEAIQLFIAVVNGGMSNITTIRTTAQLSTLLAAIQAEAIAEEGTANGWYVDDDVTNVGERGHKLVPLGADGTPLIDEELPLEVAAARGTSVGSASWFVRDIVNLKVRHPLTWAAIQECRIPLWQAQHVAQMCAFQDLSCDQALAIDAQIAPALGKVGVMRLKKLIEAAMMKVDPDGVEERARRSQQTRYVEKKVAHADPASTDIYARVDTSDAVFFDAMLDRVAQILSDQGDTRDKDHRRATAVGILATPAVALSMLGLDTSDPDHVVIPAEIAATALPTTRINVVIHQDHLADDQAVVRVEEIGPALKTQISKIVGHSKVRVTPIVYVNATEPGVDAYEIPDRIREQVIQRDRYEVFPFSSRTARNQDLDHTIPYQRGKPKQTQADNLGPLSRKVHRAKTHAGFELVQTEPGVFWWRTRRGQIFRVGPDGTTDLTPKPFCQKLKEEPPPF